MWWQFIALGILLGALVEAIAWLFRLWEFRRRIFVLVAVVVMYGLVMGSLAALTPRGAWLRVFVIAALVGLVVELWNLQFAHWWRFPDGQPDQGRRRAVMIVVLGLLWGVVPLAIAEAHVGLQRWWRGPVSPLERMEQREQALRQRRELLLQRLEDVDARLRATEHRRRQLERIQGSSPSEQRRTEETR
jgi:hypothetical protein